MNRSIVFAICLLIGSSISVLAQPASWQPAMPRIGDVVTISYNPRLGTISPTTGSLWLHWGVLNPETGSWSTPPQPIWPAGSRLHSDNVAVQSPMTRGTDSIWTVTIDFDTSVHDIAFVFTDGATSWDNNNNHNWIINFVVPGTVSWWTPEDPVPGNTITLFYDARPGTLPDNATNVILHWGVNETSHGAWQLPPSAIWPAGTIPQGQAAQTPLISLGQGLFQLVIHTDTTIHSLHYVFTDGTNWDNHGNLNWDIFLTPPVIPLTTHRIFRYDPRSAFAGVVGPVTSVNLAGTFNNWSTSATPLSNIDQYGNRWADVVLPVGTTNYKFVINGSNWQIDPDNPRNNSNDNNNSMITVTADSFPQVYSVYPRENSVFATGTMVSETLMIRPGDAGPGLTNQAGVSWGAGIIPGRTWNPTTGQMVVSQQMGPGPEIYNVRIHAMDSVGRIGDRDVSYGFHSGDYMAVDPYLDYLYEVPDSLLTEVYDIMGLWLRERSNGDSLEIMIKGTNGGNRYPLFLLTISSSISGYAEIEGFGGELRVPDLSAGGVAMLMLNPDSPYYTAGIHNRLHPMGNLATAGAVVSYTEDTFNYNYVFVVAKADLEASLGSYQTAWNYSCATFIPGSAAEGYCREIGPEMGGVAGDQDPDCIDVAFMATADVKHKMAMNYGLTRRMTLDADGRGLAAVTPQQIGPHMASAGPVCRILTQGAPTTDATQIVVARITSIPALTQVWLMQNATRINATMAGDSFMVPVVLTEGANRFVAYAVDTAGDTGRSPAMTFTLNIDHAPTIRITNRVQGGNCVLDASASTDPEQQTITYHWVADPANPAQVTLQNPNSAIAQFTVPLLHGEYYFDLTASDPDGHARTARTFFTISDSAHGFSSNECADWVDNAIIYEIFVRSYSAGSQLSGVTADLDRLQDLGINCIWLMPIFEGPSDHGYEITDYYTIEQDYGTAQDFHALVSAAHARGIRVILDMVINHTSINHPFMQDCMRNGRYSHYWDWYDRDGAGNPTHYYDWTSLPNLNLNNAECAAYFIDMCKFWIEEFDIDGYRCDVAWGPLQRSPQFWVQWRAELKKIKPECLLLAEADASNFQIFTDKFDLAFDWNLHHQGSSSFQNMFPQIPGFQNLTELVTNYGVGWPPYKNPLRFLENHDETRFASANTAAQTKLASSFMMTIPGDVMLYAGQEIGTTSQRGLPSWGSDPNGFYPHYYRLTNARKLLPALRTGTTTVLSNSQGGTCFSYSRYLPGEVPVVWAGNFSSTSQVVSVSVNPALLGLHPDSTYVVSDLLTGITYSALGSQLGSMVTSLGAYQSRVWAISNQPISVDVPPAKPAVPTRIELGMAYPNPFNPSTVLPLELNAATFVSLKVYDMLGREVSTLMEGPMSAGFHQLTWNGSSNGREVASGLYFAVLRAGNVHQIRKLMLVR